MNISSVKKKKKGRRKLKETLENGGDCFPSVVVCNAKQWTGNSLTFPGKGKKKKKKTSKEISVREKTIRGHIHKNREKGKSDKF